MNVVFPDHECYLKPNRAKRYYKHFYQFLINSLQYAGANIQYTGCTSVGEHKFKMKVDDQEIIIDYGDSKEVEKELLNHPFYFKFHYDTHLHYYQDNVFPFTPISFYDWNHFFRLSSYIRYNAKGNIIINRQRAYGNAVKRRREVKKKLQNHFNQDTRWEIVQQENFWKEINNSLIGVFVPGQRIDILDRGQLQYMAFGACTISPKLSTTLPYYKKLKPGKHFIECKPDFSDLIDKINWCKKNREACSQIGQNAQQLFLKTCIPSKKWEWVNEIIHERANFRTYSNV